MSVNWNGSIHCVDWCWFPRYLATMTIWCPVYINLYLLSDCELIILIMKNRHIGRLNSVLDKLTLR